MATYYVSSVSGDNTTGASWATAKTTIAAGLALATADGDIVYVDSAHSFSATSAAITWDAPTGSTGISLISVNRNGSTGTGHSGWLAGAIETVGTNAFAFNIATTRIQSLYMFGITATANSGSSGANLMTIGSTAGGVVVARSCTFDNSGTSTATGIQFGGNSGSGRSLTLIQMYDCTFKSPNVGGAKVFNIGLARVFISNATLTFNATKPTTFVISGSGSNFGVVEFVDSDLSTYNTAASQYVSVTNLTGGQFVFRNCLLSATPSAVTGTWLANNEGSVLFMNCDSGNTKTVFAYYNRLGTLTDNTSIYDNSGSTFGGTNVSWKIVTTSACTEGQPFITPWMMRYSTSTSSTPLSLKVIHDSVTNLTNRNLWGEFEYVSGSTTTQGTLATTRNAQPFDGSAVDCASDTDTWTGTGGFANPNKQKVVSTVTPGQASLIRGRLFVGTASKTLYLDTLLRTS